MHCTHPSGDREVPIFSTAIHSGHELRPEIAAATRLDAATRLREEDPYTDRVVEGIGTTIHVERSRFEVDLNRPRDSAVYRRPADAWGLDVWRTSLPDGAIERSLQEYDAFYALLASELDEMAAVGPFLVLDVHSYNHRRDGPTAPPGPAARNPEVNVGTESLDRDRWGPVVDRFIGALGSCHVRSHQIDVRENVRFGGGHLARWVHERYPRRGCALAIELKKTFMDEWTGVPDHEHIDELRAALERAATITAEALTGTATR